jgi:hypothetical protein
VATLLAVVLTLGLRLIDDTLTRYEKFAQPKIGDLNARLAGNSVLGGSLKDAFGIFNPVVFQGMIQGLTNSASALKKMGSFSSQSSIPIN